MRRSFRSDVSVTVTDPGNCSRGACNDCNAEKMSIMAEKNVYEYTTSEDRDTNDTMSLEVYESSGQFIYMPKIESYNEETMMDVSEDPSDEKHGILDDEQRIVEPNYHSLDAQTSVYYDEPPDTCQEIEIDYKPCVSSPTLLSDWKTHDDEWEENNQDDEWEENNQEDRSATDEGASFEENQIVGSCNNDADEDENVDDSDEETIATFLTTAGQRLALYAVEDSDQVFAVAVYDESGEPPTNFQFLVKSDVERLIGEGAVRTVKKPTQINKQLLTEETTSFSHDMEEQEEQDYQEDQPSPPPPPLDDYELDDLKNQQQYDIERTMKETIDTSCMKMLVEPEKEETSSHMPNEPANFVSVDMEKVTSPTPETSEIHDHVDRNETYEEIDSLNNDEIIVERSTVDNLFMENESANDELTFADIEETLGTLRTYERKFLSFNKFAKKEKEEKIIEEEEEEESPASDWADASIETDVPMPLVNDTTVIDNRVEKIIPRNKITEKITIITVNTPIQTPRGTNLVRKFPSSLLCRRNVNSKQLQQQKQPQQQQKQPQQLQKQPQQLQKLPQQQPQQQQKQPQQLQKQPQQLQKLPQPGQQRKPAVIVKGTSLLIGNNNRLPKTPTIEPPLVERPTEIITMSPKAKRPRKQQLTTLNRGDSEIIIQPATFTDPEEETTSKKRKGRRKRKPVHTQRYKMKATVAKRMAKKRGRRENEAKKQYEIIEIDVDDDDDDEEEKNRRDKERRRVVGKKKNIVEITIHDESKEKGSSDKENQVIMVGDSDDEEEAKIAGNLKNSSSLADADSPPVASSVTALICQHCSRKFRQKRAMKTHSRVCPKSPKNVRRLEERITRSTDSTTGKKQFPCKICNEKFDVVVVLARHVRSMHSMRKKVNSTDVNNAAAENSTLTSMKTRKERVKDNDESEKIDQTGEDVETIKSAAKTTETATTTTTTATVGRRKRRRRRNNKNRTGWKGQKLNCSDCAKWFSSAALLASHSLQHATKKSEKQIRRCQTCKKIIKSRLLYIRHMRMHSRVKKLQKKLHHTRQSATGNVKLATLRKRGRPRKL